MREVVTPTRLLVSRIVSRGIERAEFRDVDPEVAVDALVLPLIAACLHRHAIAPYVAPEVAPCVDGDLQGCFEFVLESLLSSMNGRIPP
jgi:hypothetical protein